MNTNNFPLKILKVICQHTEYSLIPARSETAAGEVGAVV